MDVHATEKEQIEALGKWWKENGSSIVIGVLLGLSVLLGGKAWLGYRDTQAQNASNLYIQMLGAMSQDKTNGVRDKANELIGNYSGSAYASFAALMLAKVAVDEGELDAARAQLQWAVDKAKSDEIRDVARLRLIRVLIDQGKLAEARSLLESSGGTAGAFRQSYLELEGDIALAEGDTVAAAAAYKQAIDSTPGQSPAGGLLTTKYESVAGAGDTAP